MRNRISLFILVAAASLAAAPSPAAAQSAEAEIEAVVLRLFDGMRSGDSAVVRSAFHPEARLQSVGERDGAVTLRSESVDGFVRAVGTPHPEPWDERIANLEVRVDGDLATAWMDYAFYLGPRFSHCGVNAFQFLRTAAGWQVIQIADTRRRDRCAPALGQ
jgi:hypothetical protein